jgi:DNA-binding winged helix-turn-helix (wHTH) protein
MIRVFSPFRLDLIAAQLWRGDEKIALRPKSFDVLRYLSDHPGQLVSKAALLDAVRPNVSVSDSMPGLCVAELRKALGDPAKTPQFIETVHGRGYRFIAKVLTGPLSSRYGSCQLSGRLRRRSDATRSWRACKAGMRKLPRVTAE